MRRRKTSPPAGHDLLGLVESSLGDDKAQDVVVIDLAGKTAIADAMVIATGTSQRHVGAIAEHLRERLKQAGLGTISVEGARNCDWVLLDAGDVIVHVFRTEIRTFYNLEKLWSLPPAASADAARGPADMIA